MAEKLCFVIGPIGKDGSAERKHADLLLHAVIKHVLQAEPFAYKVKRADEDADPGMIGDRVISDIIHADLVVADLTDLNPNAFYELGIRHSIEKPVIHVAKLGTQLPFDTVSHRAIFVDLSEWQSIEQARSKLAKSAQAVDEPAFHVSNPITQANASFKMRESADPRDRVFVDLQERVRRLEAKISLPPDGDTSSRHLATAIKVMDEMINSGLSQFETCEQICNGINAALDSLPYDEHYTCKISQLLLGDDGMFFLEKDEITIRSVVVSPRGPKTINGAAPKPPAK
jgi:hypothetical protein